MANASAHGGSQSLVKNQRVSQRRSRSGTNARRRRYSHEHPKNKTKLPAGSCIMQNRGNYFAPSPSDRRMRAETIERERNGFDVPPSPRRSRCPLAPCTPPPSRPPNSPSRRQKERGSRVGKVSGDERGRLEYASSTPLLYPPPPLV